MKGFFLYVLGLIRDGLKCVLWFLPKHLLISLKNCFAKMFIAATLALSLPLGTVLYFAKDGLSSTGVTSIIIACAIFAAASLLLEEVISRKNSPLVAFQLGICWGIFASIYIFLNLH